MLHVRTWTRDACCVTHDRGAQAGTWPSGHQPTGCLIAVPRSRLRQRAELSQDRRMSLTSPPDLNDPDIVHFCRLVAPQAKPRVMTITAASDARPLDCFSNVRREVERYGGRIQFGWSIWVWPSVFVEAEHHAVYAPPSDMAWVDVTPAPDAETRRVFLPDDTAVCDFDPAGVRRDNHRMPLVSDPLVEQLFRLAALENRVLSAIPGVGTVTVPERVAVKLQRVSDAKAQVVRRIGMKYTRPNQRCFCGSGEKFKRCHGRA